MLLIFSGVDAKPALGPAKRRFNQSAFVCHQRCQRLNLILIHGGGIANAAFHAACVWGQRYGGMVAFPVALDQRVIVRPTRSGDAYHCRIIPTKTETDRLIFDIFISGEDNALYECALGVCMRDVSAGRMKPPAWIMKPEGA